jgi:hypothetical protein
LDGGHQFVDDLLQHIIAEALERETVNRRGRHQDFVRPPPEAAEIRAMPDRLMVGPGHEHDFVDGRVLLQALEQGIRGPLCAAGAQLGMPVRENDHSHNGRLSSWSGRIARSRAD